VLGVLAAASLYIAFELGRFSAGYNILASLQERMHLSGAVAHLKAANRSLRAHLIELQTMDAARAREDQVVSRTIGDLQAEVANQTQELAFYRGVVAEGAPAIGLRLAMVRFSSSKVPGSYTAHVSLVRAGLPDGLTTGTLTLTVDGEAAGGKPTTLDNQALIANGSADLPYSFRYYEDLKQSVTLPAGFRPEHVTVEVRSGRKDVPPLTQTFPWSAVVAP
jgi:chorismate mutase